MLLKNIIRNQPVTLEKKERARELRRDMTPAETILWRELRGDKLGVHFRRQQVIAGFIVDFYCYKAGLVIELDGGVHQTSKQKEFDVKRDEILGQMGLRIVRFKNEEVENNLSEVLDKVRRSISGF
jgi:very-short-patch-repair endonuclease